MKNIISYLRLGSLIRTCLRDCPEIVPRLPRLDSLSLVSRQSDLATLQQSDRATFGSKISRRVGILFVVLVMSMANIGMVWGEKGFNSEGQWNVNYWDGSSDLWVGEQNNGSTVNLGIKTTLWIKAGWVKTWSDGGWTQSDVCWYYGMDKNYSNNYNTHKNSVQGNQTWDFDITDYDAVSAVGNVPGNYTFYMYWRMDNYVSTSASYINFTIPGFTTTSTSKSFGTNLPVNTESETTISFGNHYGTALTTNDCAITGTDAAMFAVRSINETGVNVVFTPTSNGAKSATLTITDANSKTCTITLSGTAVAEGTTTRLYFNDYKNHSGWSASSAKYRFTVAYTDGVYTHYPMTKCDNSTYNWYADVEIKSKTVSIDRYNPSSPYQTWNTATPSSKPLSTTDTYAISNSNDGYSAYATNHPYFYATGGKIYYDNSLSEYSGTLYLIVGHDKAMSDDGTNTFSKPYKLTNVTNTKLYYRDGINSDTWTDADYYTVIGTSSDETTVSEWGNAWGSASLSTKGDGGYTTAYKNVFDLLSGNVYLATAEASNSAMSIVNHASAASSSFNTSQTIQYALSTDDGSTYAVMSSGTTPGSISISTYRFEDGTYNSVSSSTQSISAETTGTYSATVQAAYTGETTLSASPSTGYTFAGWKIGTTETDASSPCYPTTETTYTARFNAEHYTITYKDQGGGEFTGTQVSAPSSHTYGIATDLQIPTRDNHVFVGWYTSIDCSTGAVGNSVSATLGATDYTADITLYAKWEGINLALNRPIVAGYEPTNQAELAVKIVDGNTSTAWTTFGNDNNELEWFYIDLGAYYMIDSVQAVWGEVYSTDYLIQSRQNAPGDEDLSDETKWFPLAKETGATASTTKKTSINAPARYLRVRSLSRNGGFLRLYEFRAIGSDLVAEHESIPIITSATATYNNDGKAYITPVAKDDAGNDISYFRVYNPQTESWSLQQLDGNGQIVMDGFSACVKHELKIQAMDQAALLSAEYTVDVQVPVIPGANIATTAIFTAGTSSGDLEHVNDGNRDSRWEVATGTIAGTNEWLAAELDAVHYISTLDVYWETHAGGGTRPKDYEIQVSYDGTHYARVLHYTSKPGDQETYTLNVDAKYVRIFVNKHDQYAGMCIREVEIYGQCGNSDGKPVMLEAEGAGIYATSADIYVSAIHETIAPEELLYHVDYESTAGNGSLTIEAEDVEEGIFRMTGLSKNTTYTLTIYAVKAEDIPANRSENYKTVEFTTEGDYSNYYFASDVNGWLGVNSGEWTEAMNAWRFQTTEAPGIYRLEHEVPETRTCTFILYDRANSTRTLPQDNKLNVTAGGYNFIMTAKDLNSFVSNYHTIYIAGSAVGTEADDMSSHPLTWRDATHAEWEGTVTPGGTFQLIFNKPYGAVTTNICTVITPTAVTYDGTGAYAKLIFDLETWEYQWTSADTYYFNGESSTSWSDITNWLNGSVPDETKDVVLNAPVVVDTNAKAGSVVLANDATLTIGANKSLVVTGTITRENGSPTTASDLIIRSTEDGNGTLIFENDGNEATVEMYSKATTEGEDWTWQYIGVPFTGAVAKNTYVNGYLYSFSSSGDWQVVHANDVLVPFEGYSVSYPTAGHIYSMSGVLAPTTTQEITVPASGYKVIGNSWTAPIYVKAFTADDFSGIDVKSVYLFNTGSDVDGTASGASERYSPGTYVTIPINAAAATGDSLIAPLQGFYVDNTSNPSTATLTMDYERLVRPVGNRNTAAGAMHAPKRVTESEQEEPVVLKLWAVGNRYDDRLIILEDEHFTAAYDAGWDGEKWDSQGNQPMLYTHREDGTPDAVSAIPTIDGTSLMFRAGEDSQYTIRMEYSAENEPLYLYDIQADIYTRVETDATYTFYTHDKQAHTRFLLTRTRAPQVPTDNREWMNPDKEKAVKFIDNNRIYIFRNGVIYDATGKRVKG